MHFHYLPSHITKTYSPVGVMGLLKTAEKESGGSLEAVFKNKHKYKVLIEMYHAGFLALALYKKYGARYKFNLAEGQNPPDLYLIQTVRNGAVPLEIMELYKYKSQFKTYSELAQHVWNTKGFSQQKNAHLLLTSRMAMEKFNVSEFIREIHKYQWSFERIWLSIYTKRIDQWTFFEIYPPAPYNDTSFIYFNINTDKRYLY